ncbi:MAG: hypothetical protein K9M19_05135 [Candidatus Marinimicrobia bacterium]|nr:hypothetical protein [Candidatus Neomarinimicrobiota bacterium]
MQEYNRTDEQIHYLSQLIAKVNRSFLEPQDDDSHTNLFFDPLSRRVYGRWVTTPAGPLIFALELDNFQFQWLDSRFRVLQKITVAGKDLEQIEDETMKGLDGVGLASVDLRQPLHFKLPSYSVSGKTQNKPDSAGLAQWQFFRSLANDTAAAVLGHFQVTGEVRIWPHHFDTGISGQVLKSLAIGFGLAMADNLVNEPYFYLAGYGEEPFEYTGLTELDAGTWVTGDSWRGALLPLIEIPENSLSDARDMLHRFVLKSAAWYLEQSR